MEMNKTIAQDKLTDSIIRHAEKASQEIMAAALAAEASGKYALQLQLYGAYNQICGAVAPLKGE